MIPANVEQFLKNRNELGFFVSEDRAACAEIHESVRRYVENGTETIMLNVDTELLQQAETMLSAYGWTIEEAAVLFFMWCAACPKEMSAWWLRCREEKK